MITILDTIAQDTRKRVAECKSLLSMHQLKKQAESMDKRTGFPFEQAIAKGDLSFICECKKASPSKGLLSPDFPYLQIAHDYEDAGASAISVLTEPNWFLGSSQFLEEIAASVSIPCLRKDFIIDEYMLYESKCIGAAAVLLICSLLDERTLRRYISICDVLGLSALVEVHDEKEIEFAIRAGARVIGVNNRSLKDFSVDIQNSCRLRQLVPENILFIAESGIKTAQDIQALRDCKVDGVLIGETLMCTKDKKATLDLLRGTAK